jgi:3-hydroxybutyryl-CoA dehydratase
MLTSIHTATLVTYHAAWRLDQGLAVKREAAMAKLTASETANRVADEASRIFASYGFAMEYPVQRFFRDARFLLLGGGTSEMHRSPSNNRHVMSHRVSGRYFEEFKPGETFESAARTVEAGDVSLFAGLTGDFNPLHMDEETAKTLPFGTRVAHGMLTLGISAGHINQMGLFTGTTLALLGIDKLRFTAPVRFGDTIHTELTVRESKESSKPDRGVVMFDTIVRNHRGEAVLQYEQAVLLRRVP